MRIAEILISKGYTFTNKKMWKIAIAKALAAEEKKNDEVDRPKEDKQ